MSNIPYSIRITFILWPITCQTRVYGLLLPKYLKTLILHQQTRLNQGEQEPKI